MQTRKTHAQMRSEAQYYEDSVEFMESFDGDSFDEEVNTDVCWMGFVRNEAGRLELVAEYVYGADGESGMGWCY